MYTENTSARQVPGLRRDEVPRQVTAELKCLTVKGSHMNVRFYAALRSRHGVMPSDKKSRRKRVVQWSLAERRPYFSYDPFSVILTFPIRERAYLYDPFSARLFCMTLYRQDSVSRPWSVKKSHVSIFSGVYFSESWTHDNIASEQNRARADHASSSYRASTEQPPSNHRAGATTEQVQLPSRCNYRANLWHALWAHPMRLFKCRNV